MRLRMPDRTGLRRTVQTVVRGVTPIQTSPTGLFGPGAIFVLDVLVRVPKEFRIVIKHGRYPDHRNLPIAG